MDLGSMRALVIIGSNPATVSFANHFLRHTKCQVAGLIEQFEGVTYPHVNRNNKSKNVPPKGRCEDVLGDEWNRLYVDDVIPSIFLKKGHLNTDRIMSWTNDLCPDIIVSHGPERISQRLIDIPTYGGLNIHWGLSPYYRGMHTIRWPLVENRLECIGLTIHMLDDSLDTGPIVHQSRPKLHSHMTYREIEYSLTNIAKDTIDDCISFICGGGTGTRQNWNIGRHFWAKDWTQIEQELVENKDVLREKIDSYLSQKSDLDERVTLMSSV